MALCKAKAAEARADQQTTSSTFLTLGEQKMTTINIDRKALKAVSRFMAHKDIRYYLNGVCVKSTPIETRIIATDGHTLAMHRGDWKDENIGTCEGLIVPDTAVKAILAWKLDKRNPGIVTLTHSATYAAGDEWRAANGDNVVVFRAIDAKFPDYMRVIPKECSGEPGIYNAEYLIRVQDAACDFTSTGKKQSFASIAHNGTGAAVATIKSCNNFVAVIMPMRGDFAQPEEWAWAFEPMKQEVTATHRLK